MTDSSTSGARKSQSCQLWQARAKRALNRVRDVVWFEGLHKSPIAPYRCFSLVARSLAEPVPRNRFVPVTQFFDAGPDGRSQPVFEMKVVLSKKQKLGRNQNSLWVD